MKTGVTSALLLLATAATAAADSVVADVEHRLFWEGAQSANDHLRANKGLAMAAFNRHTAGCEPKALELAVQLRRAGRGDAALAHGEALRAAAALCHSARSRCSAERARPGVRPKPRASCAGRSPSSMPTPRCARRRMGRPAAPPTCTNSRPRASWSGAWTRPAAARRDSMRPAKCG
jgi:hypothetical protein